MKVSEPSLKSQFFAMPSAFLMIFAPLNPYKMDVYSILI